MKKGELRYVYVVMFEYDYPELGEYGTYTTTVVSPDPNDITNKWLESVAADYNRRRTSDIFVQR